MNEAPSPSGETRDGPLLDVQGLVTEFEVSQGLFARPARLRAVNHVDLTLEPGETLGIVGESGCGKSTLGRSIMRLIEPTEGRILWQGRSLTELTDEQMRLARRDMQIIFQDPIASLDPRMTVGQIIAEPLTVFEKGLSRAERTARVVETMDAVGLAPEMINRFPHEFSGGQAQRIGIARAIVTRPRLVVCDEPVSALDVSIQAQIVTLLKRLQEEFNLAYLFISHDLSIVRLISDRILVLYLGQVVEIGDEDAVFDNPAHPYTQALLAAAPIPDPVIARQRQSHPLIGDPPSPLDPPPGCVFSSRCPHVHDACRKAQPDLRTAPTGQKAACVLVDETSVPKLPEGQ
ncbi:ABC transporter ATP-binding protein [Roseitalea porphyridii]|uniref:ATP-binding cassette domain-containing protein n=1 Tax=Roseitalea porphyridii TaxID=1852022 RepID=A0A4P6UXZ8_9HYPH|nr:oligopeptide/dipeptide ABC transporter ATP-binding protein [Roseitalea porphyridii]QBK29911.1 ATP-binding cassette domain-containing protein [Roseitalea porphyridii]